MRLQELFSSPSLTLTAIDDPTGIGSFVTATTETPSDLWSARLGAFVDVARYTVCHRYEPFWMEPKAGLAASDVPSETQWLLAVRNDGSYLLLVPLAHDSARASLRGGGDGLELVIETGDPAIGVSSALALYIATGDDPYALLQDAAEIIAARLGTARLRTEKPLPSFVDQFGWCTWDAFYQEVNQENVREGLESFAEGGVTPRYLILDDGWQSVVKKESGETQLTAFAANEKFGGELRSTVMMAKNEFDIEQFFVWHAVGGYWGGVDAEAMPGYGVRSVARKSSDAIHTYQPGVDVWWGPTVGVVPAEQIYRFYQDYHRYLRLQGVDGVKVDNQASLESVAAGMGGRVALMRAYREALEGSVAVHFNGNLINCMSNANEMHLHTLASTLTRTSTDFWPKRPETHGLHLYTNAQVSLWFGQWVHPDWDMFQSGHEAGAFHAAGRALSGGPVYVSDKPGAHDFELLKKLVTPTGRVLRCAEPGVPTKDCLFSDPTREDVLLKLVNESPSESQYAGYLGIFNCRYSAENPTKIVGEYGPEDLRDHPFAADAEQFAVYLHNNNDLFVMPRTKRRKINLPQLGFEVATFVPIYNGFAIAAVLPYFCGASLVEMSIETENRISLSFTAGGTVLCYSERRPKKVIVYSAESEESAGAPKEVGFTYDTKDKRLSFTLSDRGTENIDVELQF